MRQGVDARDIAVIAQAHLRYAGTDSALPIPLASLRGMRALFEIAHQKRFGFISPEKEIEIEAIEVEARGGGEPIAEPELAARRCGAGRAPCADAALHQRKLARGAGLLARRPRAGTTASPGPPSSSRIIRPSWSSPNGRRRSPPRNHLLLARIAKRQAARVGKQADPVMVEVFNNLFVSIAEQMGYALQNTARSVNIKERLDFSCAIFDAKGRLIANAPHIPVHLGSMDRSVETMLARDRRGAEARRRLYAERAL